MLSATLVTHLRYNRWATEIILTDAIPLTAEQLVAPTKSSFGSIYDTLVHLYQFDRVWLDRLEGRPSGNLADYEAPGCMWELREAWLGVHDRMIACVQALDESDLSRVIDYKNLAGQPFSYPIWQMILHIVNHGTHHRGQVTTTLRQIGRTPTNMDLLRYFRTMPAEHQAELVETN